MAAKAWYMRTTKSHDSLDAHRVLCNFKYCTYMYNMHSFNYSSKLLLCWKITEHVCIFLLDVRKAQDANDQNMRIWITALSGFLRDVHATLNLIWYTSTIWHLFAWYFTKRCNFRLDHEPDYELRKRDSYIREVIECSLLVFRRHVTVL